jgi:hypothetical protein
MRGSALIAVVLALGGAAWLGAAADAPPPRRPSTPPAVPFISDDYATARAQALARKVPLFIESWAPW